MALGNAAAADVRLIVWCRIASIKLSPIPPKWRNDTVARLPFPIGVSGSSVPGAGATIRIWW